VYVHDYLQSVVTARVPMYI